MQKEVYEFISKQTKDLIVERKKCKVSWGEFAIFQSDVDLLEKISPVIDGKKYQIPLPELCPEERQRRRLARRNERKLYHTKCDLTWKSIISLYSPDKDVKVYYYKSWWSDEWDPMDYGKNFDFDRPFFEQFMELFHKVPRISTYNKMTENTEYWNNLAFDKDCYLLFITYKNQNCYYGHILGYCKNCVDMLRAIQCQNCYDCVKVQNCYECQHCFNCDDCFSSTYLKDCLNISKSHFCIWLRNQKNHFLNKKYSSTECKALYEKCKQDSEFFQQVKSQYDQLLKDFPNRDLFIEESENSVWDYLDNSKDCNFCFDLMMAENCRYCFDGANIVDSMDCSFWWAAFELAPAQLCYEGDNVTTPEAKFCSTIFGSSGGLLYCDTCNNVKNCFACIGLRDKSYCIFNKQYSKEEYELLVPKIIAHMQATGERGNFFPISDSIFGYNETEAQIYYPMTKEEVLLKWWKRQDENITQPPKDADIVSGSQINNLGYSDSILQKVFICETTEKPFKLIRQELEFYKKYNISLPKRCPDQRHLDRMSLKNTRTLYYGKCVKCNMDVATILSPKVTKKVYCKNCYNKTIYG